MKRKATARDGEDLLEELERAVALLERLKGVSPELDELHAKGLAVLARQRAADEAVRAAARTLRLATAKLDAGVREMMNTFGRKNLEAMLAYSVQTGDTESAEMLRHVLDHAKRLSKKDRKKRGGRDAGD